MWKAKFNFINCVKNDGRTGISGKGQGGGQGGAGRHVS